MIVQIILEEQINTIKKLVNTDFIYKTILVGVVFISWIKSNFIGFMNDDFQIIGWHNPKNFIDVFKPFWTPDVSVYYWRPLVNTLHSLTIYFLGFNSIVFHFTNLLIYILTCIALYNLLLKLKFKEPTALFTSIIFGLVPAHEILIGWIAGRGDLFACLFILLSANNYLDYSTTEKKKFLLFYYLTLILGMLSKEIAFPAVALPLLIDFKLRHSDNSIVKSKKYSSLVNSFVSPIVGLLVFSIRFLIGPQSIANSPNLIDLSIMNILKNFVLYVPSSIFSPVYHSSILFSMIISTIIILIFAWLIFIFLLKAKESFKSYLPNILFGSFWFVLFIIPVLGLFMRWYVFTASLGLFIILASIIEFSFRKLSKSVIVFIIMFCSLTLLVNAAYRMNAWVDASQRISFIYKSLKNIDLSLYQKLTLWGVPDKINDVNVMKVGVEQAVQFYSNNKKIDVFSPLRIIIEEKSAITANRITENSVQLKGSKAAFIPVFKNSGLKEFKKEYLVTEQDYLLEIVNANTSFCLIKHLKILPSHKNLYFAEKGFIPL